MYKGEVCLAPLFWILSSFSSKRIWRAKNHYSLEGDLEEDAKQWSDWICYETASFPRSIEALINCLRFTAFSWGWNVISFFKFFLFWDFPQFCKSLLCLRTKWPYLTTETKLSEVSVNGSTAEYGIMGEIIVEFLNMMPPFCWPGKIKILNEDLRFRHSFLLGLTTFATIFEG